MTDATNLSGPLLDYYAALAENMPNPRLRKHEREDTYICVISQFFGKHVFLDGIESYSPTTNPALALPIIEKLINQYGSEEFSIVFGKLHEENIFYCQRINADDGEYLSGKFGYTLTEAALRALVAWKFPDRLPDPVYEKEDK